jgi:hypothetical protein
MLPLIGLCDFAQTRGDANSSIAHEQVTPLCAGEYLSILASMASRTLSDSRAQDHGEQVDFSHMVDAASRYISSPPRGHAWRRGQQNTQLKRCKRLRSLEGGAYLMPGARRAYEVSIPSLN